MTGVSVQESFANAVESAEKLSESGVKAVICERGREFVAVSAEEAEKLTPVSRERLDQLAESWDTISRGKLVQRGWRFTLSPAKSRNHFYHAQLNWNSAAKPPGELLANDGDCCLVPSSTQKEYELHVLKDGSSVIYQVRVKDRGIVVTGDSRSTWVERLQELLDSPEFPASTIQTGRGEARTTTELYYRVILPTIKHSGDWIKVSRKDYPQVLPQSLWVGSNGEIYKQYHRVKDMETDIAKHKLGEGGWKVVWSLESDDASTIETPMIRARIKTERQMKEVDADQLMQLSRDLGSSKYHLLPKMVIYKNRMAMVMPQAVGDLKDHYHSLTRLGKLRAALSILKGLQDAERADWIYFDMKGENILMMSPDPDDPDARIADHDLCRRNNDPRLTNDKTVGSREIKFPKYARLDDVADPKDRHFSTEDAHEGHLWCWAAAFAQLEAEAKRPLWFGRNKQQVYDGRQVTPKGVASEKLFENRDVDGWGRADSFERLMWDCLLLETPDAANVAHVDIDSAIHRLEALITLECKQRGIAA